MTKRRLIPLAILYFAVGFLIGEAIKLPGDNKWTLWVLICFYSLAALPLFLKGK